MNDDYFFRWILLAGLVAIMPFGFYFRFRSHTGEKLDRSQEGLFILGTLRPLAAVRVIAVIAFIINPDYMKWSSIPLPALIRWAGVGVGVVAAGLLLWTMRTLGRNLTDTVVTRQEHFLVTSGPYRFVRHPFYLAFALAIIADSLVTANWFIAGTGIALFCIIALRTRIEERNLVKRFGDEYRNYMSQTGRYFPRIIFFSSNGGRQNPNSAANRKA